MFRPLVWIGIACFCGQSLAQDARVEIAVQKPPYYVGEPIVIQFTVEGFEEQPQPTCSIDAVSGQLAAGVRGQVNSVSPSVVSKFIRRNGQIHRSREVTHKIQYLVTADRPGDFRIGPFLIAQNGKQARVEAVSMSFKDVPLDPLMQIRLELPSQPVYPGQRVPVEVEWWYASEFVDGMKLRIYSPLFDQFRFAPDPPASRRGATLPLDTKEGRLALAATARDDEENGQKYVVVAATRTLLPDRVGEFQIEPITATLRKPTAWARSRSRFNDLDDLGFGLSLFSDLFEENRRPVRVSLTRAVGSAHALVVKPLPAEGRPESFAGAVGSGFSIDVTADRTVVRVGDPITLNVVVRGSGSIESASLPLLSADGGINPQQFRLPSGDIAGALSDGGKEFRVSVRVTDEAVTEIPALAYSWFDPEEQTYQTSYSKPIALRVMPATVVSANDVVTSQPAGSRTPDKPARQTSAAARSAARPGTLRYTLSGADLALEPDAARVLRDAGSVTRETWIMQMVLYGSGFLLIVATLVDRKRRAIDPSVTARRKAVRQQQSRIARAANLPRRAAAEELAAALRVLIAEVPDITREGVQEVVAECEAIAYAPGAESDARLNDDLIARAKRAAEL